MSINNVTFFQGTDLNNLTNEQKVAGGLYLTANDNVNRLSYCSEDGAFPIEIGGLIKGEGDNSLQQNGTGAQALSEGSTSFGLNSKAGCKGYYFNTIGQCGDGTLWIGCCTNQPTNLTISTTGDPEASGSGECYLSYSEGDIITIICGDHHFNIGTIRYCSADMNNKQLIYCNDKNLDTIWSELENSVTEGNANKTNGTVGTKELGDTYSLINPGYDDYVVFVPSKPDKGLVEVCRHSFSSGWQNNSAGSYTFTAGRQNTIGDSYGAAVGRNNIVGYAGFAAGWRNECLDRYNFATGDKNIIKGRHAAGIGYNNKVNGHTSFAVGSSNTLDGSTTFSVGNNNTTLGTSSFAGGSYCNSRGDRSLAFGSGSKSYSFGAVAFGASIAGDESSYDSIIGVSGTNCYQFSAGFSSKAVGNRAVALGQRAQAIGEGSFAVGWGTTDGKLISSNKCSIALGEDVKATGSHSFVTGYNNESTNSQSFAFGLYTKSTGQQSVAGGRGSASAPIMASNQCSFAFGRTSTWYGVNKTTAASGEASVAIGDGCISSGRGSFSAGLINTASNTGACALGAGNVANVVGQLVCGRFNKTNNAALFIVGNTTLNSSYTTDSNKHTNAFEVHDNGRIALGEGSFGTSLPSSLAENELFFIIEE